MQRIDKAPERPMIGSSMTSWAVSDLNATELDELAALFRDRAAPSDGRG